MTTSLEVNGDVYAWGLVGRVYKKSMQEAVGSISWEVKISDNTWKSWLFPVKLFIEDGDGKKKGDYISKNGDVYTGKVYAQIKIAAWMGAETKIEEYIWVLSFQQYWCWLRCFSQAKKKIRTVSEMETLEKKVDMPAFRSKIRR